MWPFIKGEKKGESITLPKEALVYIPIDADLERYALSELEKAGNRNQHPDYWLVFNYLMRKDRIELSKLADDEIRGAELCAAEFSADNQLVWICQRCYKVCGLLKTPFKMDGKQYGAILTQVIVKRDIACPACKKASPFSLLSSRFLLSGKTICWVVLKEVTKKVFEGGLAGEELQMELVHTQLLKLGDAGEKRIEKAERELYGKSFNELAMEKGIPRKCMLDVSEEGYKWSAFGRFKGEEGIS